MERSIVALPKLTVQYSGCGLSMVNTQRVFLIAGRSSRVALKNLAKYAEKSSKEISFAASEA